MVQTTESNQPTHFVKSETQKNNCCIRVGVMGDSAIARSGSSKEIRTYKRRKNGRLSHQEYVACDFGGQRYPLEERPDSTGTCITDKLPEVVSANKTSNGSVCDTTTVRCQRVLSNVLASEEFASLSKLLTRNLQGIRVENLLSTSLIATRMNAGLYEHSPMLFSADIQEVWKKLLSVGNEMSFLCNRLSELSRTSYAEQFHSSITESHPKAHNVGNDGIVDVCKLCGEKAEVRDCLACDHCEDMYHVSCVQPAGKGIPKKSWYCLNCTSKGIGSPHECCVACERLKSRRVKMDNSSVDINTAFEEDSNELEENSSSNMDHDHDHDHDHGVHRHSEGEKDSEVCQICGTEVENGGRFITCDHPYCPHKYYHIRCLTSRQIKLHGVRWYCPSCLCRNCLINKDDDKIVLCDGCDDAYHIYCMKPPLTSVPKGKWFCTGCEAAIQKVRKARKAIEKMGNLQERKSRREIWNLERKLRENGAEEEEDIRAGGMDMLLNAANTLKDQEQNRYELME
ncbi:PREDICTED: PHD finger protein EHD3-like [Tarenaya hassleriana]|uniref:PHD finger protein EHD3-like n=1 Tax=Tarenaya hassleriana TaxID=28532 RepID=UPI00053C5F73|nr:PREDICTED: PHD finger protein EHD3-like [Tarenaya hassleriana]XP_010537347.1 PREDICTED: PHD finger protein EHD3-like [Tarenaya hassleriana]